MAYGNDQNNRTKQLNLKQIRVLHLIFDRLIVVVLFCSLKRGLTQKIRMLCVVVINSVLLNHFHVFGFLLLINNQRQMSMSFRKANPSSWGTISNYTFKRTGVMIALQL